MPLNGLIQTEQLRTVDEDLRTREITSKTKGSLPWFLVINASFFAYKVDNQE